MIWNEFMTVKDAAKITGLSDLTIRELCKTGDIGTYLKRKGAKNGKYIISAAKLKAFIGTN